jgi:hypothetical protein
VFVSGSDEPRHLFDVVLGAHALTQRGVPAHSIHIYTDDPAYQQHLQPYGLGNVRPVAGLLTGLATHAGYEVLVIVVTGHGSEKGIPAVGRTDINPADLLGAARACPGIRGGAIIFGQCFAGLFNYTNAGTAEPQFCMLGATSLNESLSDRLTLPAPIPTQDGSVGLKEWAANIFLAHFFAWVLNPRDVDGDGRFTLMDGYKHAIVLTNKDLRSLKQRAHADVGRFQTQLLLTPATQTLLIDALTREANRAITTLYMANQEPWVLHSLLTSDFELALGPAGAGAAAAASAP